MKVEEQWNINLQIKSKLKVSLPFIMTQRNCLTAAGQFNFHCSLKLFARLWVTLTKSSFRSAELFFYDVAINVIIFLRIEYPFCSRKWNIVEYFEFQRSITTRWIMTPGARIKKETRPICTFISFIIQHEIERLISWPRWFTHFNLKQLTGLNFLSVGLAGR